MKTLVLFALMALGGAALADQKCPMCPGGEVKPLPTAAPQCDTCAAAQPCAHCDSLTAANPDARERAFWAESAKMQANDKVEHGELMACCASKLSASAGEDCCSAKAAMGVGVKAPGCSHEEGHADHGMKAKGAHHAAAAPKKMAAFKVFAGGQYHMYCCEHMASEARESFRLQGMTVGSVQKVVGKHVL